MKNNLDVMVVDKVNLKNVIWINYPNKVWERELILLILHQEGARTKSELIEKGFPQHLVERHLGYLTKKGKVKEDEETMKYSRTSSRHKFHYDGASGKLE